MVFGNMGETSATGVAFTRNPSTGENALYGEFLINAQGEDVVAGIRTPQDITEAAQARRQIRQAFDGKAMPEAYAELCRIYGILEKHYRDMQDMEFTIQEGKLWMLQTRSGKRTAKAALKDRGRACPRRPDHRDRSGGRSSPARSTSFCIRPSTPKAERKVLTAGLPASPGAAAGEIVFTSEAAEARQEGPQEGHPRPCRDLALRTFTACTPPRAS
jgi:pyruvate,orthophosphate dikinase